MELAVADVVLALLSPTAAAAAVVFLGRYWIERWDARSLEALKAQHAKELERFRGELQIAHGREMEGLRHELARLAHERDERVTQLVAKRAAIAGRLYAQLAHLRRIAQETLGGFRTKDGDRLTQTNLVEAFRRNFVRFSDYYDRHRPFIPQAACQLIDRFIDEAWQGMIEHHFSEGRIDSGLLQSAAKRVQEQISPIVDLIENELRAMLEPPAFATDVKSAPGAAESSRSSNVA